jgi:aminopeptidase 2
LKAQQRQHALKNRMDYFPSMCNKGQHTKRDVLPKHVKPSHYNVTLVPGLESFKFTGQVSITIHVSEPTKTIVLNQNDLIIHSSSLVCMRAKEGLDQVSHWDVDSVTHRYFQKPTTTTLGKELLTFEYQHEVPEGVYILHVEFQGNHNDEMVGFYRSSFEAQGQKKHMVVTQFEATDCRRCFPCWDEPNQKATFDCTLVVEPQYTALANMGVKSETELEIDGKKFKSITYERTPVMSTYLVAFAVGEYDYVEAFAKPKIGEPIRCRVYTLKGQSKLGEFALDVGVRTLEFFTEYFGIPYALSKCDQLAVPDFAAGAMENWGLITYREEALLFDPKTSSAASREQICQTVCHELAHQWFGNLVTMDWWDELWLNEGFATAIGTLATDRLFPEWNIFNTFIDQDLGYALNVDGQRSSHPIQVEVSSGTEINQIFDGISYSKGASVIRMLESFLGTEKFRLGVSAYLKKHQFSNATTIDLWTALQQSSGIDVVTLMSGWVLEMGYPVLKITEESFDESKNELTLSLQQNRYLNSGDVTAEDDKVTWFVPIQVLTQHGITAHTLTEKEGKLTFAFEKDGFYKLNAKATGFYRVNYTVEQLTRLGQHLAKNIKQFAVEDRISLILDVFACAESGAGATVAALELIKAYKEEDEFVVLNTLTTQLDKIQDVWYKDTKTSNAISQLLISILKDRVATLGFDYHETDSYAVEQLRTLVIRKLALNRDADTVAELLVRLEDFFAGKQDRLSPNLRRTAFVSLLRTTQDPVVDLERVLQVYQKSEVLDDRMAALGSLGAINHIDLLKKVLNEYLMNPDIVKAQDFMYPLVSIVRFNPNKSEAVDLVGEWIQDHWDAIHAKLASSLGLLGHVVKIGFGSAVGQEYIDRLQAWSSGTGLSPEAKQKLETQLLDCKRPLAQTLETMKVRHVWFEREKDTLFAWVTEQGLVQ